MTEKKGPGEDLGHEPDETDDRRFAPVTRGSDARGRTVPPEEEGMARQEDEAGGTGVPGGDVFG